MLRRSFPIALSLLAVAPLAAEANGRFPATVGVHTQPGDDQTIVVPLTFGLLISRDDGNSFQWICEDAIGYGGTYDPDYSISPDGTMWATTFNGLRVSRDGGCTWADVTGELDAAWIEEVQVAADGKVWVATASGGKPNNIYRSPDTSGAFTAMGLLREDAWWKSIRVAPSDGNRVYVTGYKVVGDPLPDGGTTEPRVLLFRSDTGGTGADPWRELAIGDFEFGPQPQLFLLEVMPDNPDIVFARVQAAVDAVGDAVYRSSDGGDTWSKVLELPDRLRAFAIIAGGSKIFAGSVKQVRVSTDGGLTWSPAASEPQMACVGERADGTLFSCGANWDPDFFALGRSTDGGASWSKIVRFSEISGPLKCNPGTVQFDTCTVLVWPSIVEQFGIGKADAGPDTTGDTSTDTSATSTSGATPTPPGGCGCGAAGGGASLVFAIGMIPLFLRRRRRRPTGD